MNIRHANADDPDDLAALAYLADQLGYPISPEQVLQRLTSICSRRDHAVLVAEDDDNIVGWVHVFGAERLESDPCAEIGGLVIDESQRGSGWGTALLAAAENWAATQGYPNVRVRSNVVRQQAHAFYEKRGYRCAKQQAVFSKPVLK